MDAHLVDSAHVAFALRRTKPHAAAIWFVVTVAVQLVFGPAFLFADAMALPMFYSAVVYDCRNRTREYAIMALASMSPPSP